jgi:hypothetical protein
MKVNLKENEVVIKATNSIHLNEQEKIDGKLILTNQRIYFKTGLEETQKFNLEILFKQIKEIFYFKNGLFSPKGITLRTHGAGDLQFTMKDRDAWGVMINKMY